MLTTKQEWLLAIVHKAQFVEGRTRLQKIAFLATKMVKGFGRDEFYTDWASGRFGPFSAMLAEDVGSLLESGYLQKFNVRNQWDHYVERYGVSEASLDVVNAIVRAHPDVSASLDQIIQRYAHAPLMQLLHDVYAQFPESVHRSEIRSQVNSATSYQDTLLSHEFDDSD